MSDIRYAGFWIRIAAGIIDSLIIGAVSSILLVPTIIYIVTSMYYAQARDLPNFIFFYFILFLLIIGLHIGRWLYYALQWSSVHQGTVGMRVCGFKVTDNEYQRISFLNATGRYFAAFFSNFFYIGFIMIAFTEKKQGLHDFMASTYTVYKD